MHNPKKKRRTHTRLYNLPKPKSTSADVREKFRSTREFPSHLGKAFVHTNCPRTLMHTHAHTHTPTPTLTTTTTTTSILLMIWLDIFFLFFFPTEFSTFWRTGSISTLRISLRTAICASGSMTLSIINSAAQWRKRQRPCVAPCKSKWYVYESKCKRFFATHKRPHMHSIAHTPHRLYSSIVFPPIALSMWRAFNSQMSPILGRRIGRRAGTERARS